MEHPTTVRRDLIQALIAILSQGIQDGALDDAEKLLAAIRILNPSLQGLEEFASYIAIKRGFVREALQTYAGAPADTSKWYVMMALCLKLTADPTWHWHAEQSLERHDESARYAHNLAHILLGHDTSAMETAPALDAASTSTVTISAAATVNQHDYRNYLSV